MARLPRLTANEQLRLAIVRGRLASQAREWREGVTFAEFRALAAARGWTAEAVLALLATRGTAHFGGPRSSRFYELPKGYLHRVLRRGHARDDGTVIPYRGLIALYLEHVAAAPACLDAIRRCACGCGTPLFGRRRWAADACRKRMERQGASVDVADRPDRPENSTQSSDVIPDKNRDPAPTPWVRGFGASWPVLSDSYLRRSHASAHAGGSLHGLGGLA